MGLGCFGSIAKLILFIINFAIFACGAVLLVIGIVVVVDDEAIDWIVDITGGGDMDEALFQAAVYMVLTIGGLLFVVGFLGCCGACKENSCLLQMYIICVCVILALEITAGILAAVYKSDIDETIERSMYDSVQGAYYKDDTPTQAWDHMQHDWKCCGSYNHTDFEGSYFASNQSFTNQTEVVPGSCCKDAREEDGKIVIEDNLYEVCLFAVKDKDTTDELYYSKGCYQSFTDWVEEYSVMLMASAFALAGIQFIGVLMACCVKGKLND